MTAPCFDPFTASQEEAEAQPDAWEIGGPVLRWGAAQSILERRAQLEGSPIDGIAQCVRADLVAPDWLARAFLRQYDLVLNRHVASWDEAFGPAKPPAVHLSTLRLRRRYGLQVYKLFDAQSPERLTKSKSGYATAADRLGLTPKQVRQILASIRPKPPSPTPALALANDPFNLGRKRRPEN